MSKNIQYSFFNTSDNFDSSSALDYFKRPVESTKENYFGDDREYNMGFDSLLMNFKKDSLREDSIYEADESPIWDGESDNVISNDIQHTYYSNQQPNFEESIKNYRTQDFSIPKADGNNFVEVPSIQEKSIPVSENQVYTKETDKILNQSKKIAKPTFESSSASSSELPKHFQRRVPVDLSRKRRTKRKAWLPSEDQKVLDLVNKFGQAWALIASKITGRTGKQVRDRYVNKLKPDIKNQEWTAQEDKKLLSLYNQFGHKWSKISSLLHGRTEGQVKNRFYTFLKSKVSDNSDTSEPTQISTQPTSPVSQFSDQMGQMMNRPQVPQMYNNVMPPMPQYVPQQRFEMDNQLSCGYPQNYMSSGHVQFGQERANCSFPFNTGVISKQVIDKTLKMIAHYVDSFGPNKVDAKGYKGIMPTYQPVANPKAEMLQIRKKNLEFLLAKTLEELNTCS